MNQEDKVSEEASKEKVIDFKKMVDDWLMTAKNRIAVIDKALGASNPTVLTNDAMQCLSLISQDLQRVSNGLDNFANQHSNLLAEKASLTAMQAIEVMVNKANGSAISEIEIAEPVKAISGRIQHLLDSLDLLRPIVHK